MVYISEYISPIGKIILLSDDKCLYFLNFDDIELDKEIVKDNKIIKKTKKWLDIYFKGKKPKFKIPIKMDGTDFQKEVWNILLDIPYGKVITYGDIAKQIAKKHHKSKMSARAVGNAVHKNKVSIIIPCHRVVGKNNKLTGYAWGIDRKKYLLNLEGIDL